MSEVPLGSAEIGEKGGEGDFPLRSMGVGLDNRTGSMRVFMGAESPRKGSRVRESV